MFSSHLFSFILMTIVIRISQSSKKIIYTQLKFANTIVDLELESYNLKLCKHCQRVIENNNFQLLKVFCPPHELNKHKQLTVVWILCRGVEVLDLEDVNPLGPS